MEWEDDDRSKPIGVVDADGKMIFLSLYQAELLGEIARCNIAGLKGERMKDAALEMAEQGLVRFQECRYDGYQDHAAVITHLGEHVAHKTALWAEAIRHKRRYFRDEL